SNREGTRSSSFQWIPGLQNQVSATQPRTVQNCVQPRYCILAQGPLDLLHVPVVVITTPVIKADDEVDAVAYFASNEVCLQLLPGILGIAVQFSEESGVQMN